MGEKLKEAKRFKAETSKKWDRYFDEHGLSLTAEIRKQMAADNKRLEELSREAMLERNEEEQELRKELKLIYDDGDFVYGISSYRRDS